MSDLDPLGEGEDLAATGNRKPLIVLGCVALVAVLLLSFSVFRKSVVYYETPSEVIASPGATVRVSGTVVPGSLTYDGSIGQTTFRLLDPVDHSTTIEVRYPGPAPGTLKDDGQAVAEGSYRNGVFEASALFEKCPSKFGAATPTIGV